MNDEQEECDDGNELGEDGCTSFCKVELDCEVFVFQVHDPATGGCYSLFNNGKPWQLAEDDCVANGGHLASIANEQTKDIITGLIKGVNVWIGLNDIQVEGTFEWSDGTQFDFQNFNKNEPNNSSGGEDCIVIKDNDGWNDEGCTISHSYVCFFQ